MDAQNNAEYHLRHICPRCPHYRRKYRDVMGTGRCFWHEAWSRGDYKIPRHFGPMNWLRSYLGRPTNLKQFSPDSFPRSSSSKGS